MPAAKPSCAWVAEFRTKSMAMIPKLEQRIRELIATPSVSSVRPEFDQGNRPVVDLLAEWLESLAFDIEIQPLPGNAEKANLIATLGRGTGGLVLSGHTDTVPYDAGRWKHDPFGGQEDGGRIYGLGSADMKSFLAIAIEAAKQFKIDDLAQPLFIVENRSVRPDIMFHSATDMVDEINAGRILVPKIHPVHVHIHGGFGDDHGVSGAQARIDKLGGRPAVVPEFIVFL